VEINGTSYFIDTSFEHRDEAQANCEAMNMTLVTFETPGKYEIFSKWLAANGKLHNYLPIITFFYEFLTQDYSVDWFWTGGMKDVNSTRWYWEPTGNEITEFFWRPLQPDVEDISIRTCIDFKIGSGGWDDDDCDFYVMGKICE